MTPEQLKELREEVARTLEASGVVVPLYYEKTDHDFYNAVTDAILAKVQAMGEKGCSPRDHAPSTDVALDEVAQDDLLSRAKAMVLAKGWKPGDRPGLHSVVQLMLAFGLETLSKPPDRCSHPECGCDFDAVCDVALSSAEQVPGESSRDDQLHSALQRAEEDERRNAELEREVTGLRNSYWEERKAHLAAHAQLTALRKALAELVPACCLGCYPLCAQSPPNDNPICCRARQALHADGAP